MISKSENDMCIRFSITKILLFQRDAQQLRDIQRLYEAANITNRQLVYRFRERRFNHDRMLETVMEDIYDIITKRVFEDDNVRLVFEQIFYDKYADAKSLADEVIRTKGAFSNSIGKRINGLKKVAREVYNYRICTSRILTEVDGKAVGIDTDHYIFSSRLLANTSADMLISGANSLHFTETDESVFESVAFKRFLEKRKSELAEYLDCKEENLAIHLLAELKNGVVGDADNYLLDGIPQIMLFISRIVTNMQNSGPYWIDSVIATHDKFKSLPAYGYKPDIDKIIELFYMGLITEKIFEFEERGERYTKIALSRYTATGSPEADLRSISLLCIIDIVFHMLVLQQEKEHENFSWEKITGISEIEYYRLKAEQLTAENMRLKESVAHVSNDNVRLNDMIRKKTAFDNYELFNEYNNLTNAIADKDAEIESLKKRLALQDELLHELQTEEDVFEDEVDISLLKSMKFLFVGHIREALPELRKEFPNSVFMNHETDKISGLDVDAVVMLTKWMSHSMFYKVKSSNNLVSVPIIMCNSKSLNRIYFDMAEQLKRAYM